MKLSLSASAYPVRILAACAAAAELATRYVHSPLALAVLPVVVAVAYAVERVVTPDAHIENLTPAQWLEVALDHGAVENAKPADASAPTLPAAPPPPPPFAGGPPPAETPQSGD